MSSHDPDDDLVAEIKAAVGEAGTVPSNVLSAAKGAFTWRTIDAELAELVRDSASVPVAQLSLRTAATTRQLAFEVGSTRIELEVSLDRVLGQIDPPEGDEVVIESPNRPAQPVAIDRFGCFVVEPVPEGLVRLMLDLPNRRPVVSTWTRL